MRLALLTGSTPAAEETHVTEFPTDDWGLVWQNRSPYVKTLQAAWKSSGPRDFKLSFQKPSEIEWSPPGPISAPHIPGAHMAMSGDKFLAVTAGGGFYGRPLCRPQGCCQHPTMSRVIPFSQELSSPKCQ